MSDQFLRHRTALVTGGARGIGAAICRALAEAGASVAINYRNRADDAERLAKELQGRNVRAAAFQADVSGAASVAALTADERADMARALKTVLMKYDRLWNRPFPYIMVFHQAPTDGQPHPEAHLHIEFYPAYRMRDRLKYLAGSEIGAGVFTADTLPEEKAAELQAIEVHVD